MSLDVYGFVDPTFASTPQGGVQLRIPEPGDYTGPGGTWEEGRARTKTLQMVNIQPAGWKDVQFLIGQGGTVNPQDFRLLHINDGTYLYPDDDGVFAHTLEFSDGLAVRQWRVRSADNRPWRNFCRAIVERYRGSK